jgi:gamma-glutamyltranspeptidase/glutathione hydrolase
MKGVTSMNRPCKSLASVFLALALAFGACLPVGANPLTRPTILGTNNMVACGHWLAAWAGNDVLANGGNAFDAGVAMVLAQAVLEFDLFGFAGEAQTLVYSAEDRRVYEIDGGMASPKSVDLEWFRKNGLVAIPGDGLLPAGVPAMLDAMVTVLDRWGTISFNDAGKYAYQFAEEGFPMYNSFRNRIRTMEKRFKTEWPTSAEVFLPGDRVPAFGEIFRQPALARTIRRLMDAEMRAIKAGANRHEALRAVRDLFYKGEIAEEIVKFQAENEFLDDTGKKHRGNLTMDDFRSYQAKIREPWTVNYRGYDVYKCGPNTQGPVFLQQLNLLENFNLKSLQPGGADFWHLVTETAKLAHADRDKYYGDPDFVYVPKAGLLAKEYARERVKLISLEKARNEHTPGDPFRYDARTAAPKPTAVAKADLPQANANLYQAAHANDTTGTRAVDRYGNMFTCTPSGGWFTSSPIIPNLGFVLGTRLQMFHLNDPDAANAYRPGARPCTSLTPTLVLKDEKPFAVFGTPGGDNQDQYTLQTFLFLIEYGMEVQTAIDQPKTTSYNFPSLFYPYTQRLGEIGVNDFMPKEITDELARRGHKIRPLKGFTDATSMIVIDQRTGILHGGASPARDKQYVIGW